MCKNLKDLNIEESFEEIKLMTKYKFSRLLKSKVKMSALKYLTGKQGSKGKDIVYSSMQMSEYLLPTNEKLTIDEKRRLFAVKNKIISLLIFLREGQNQKLFAFADREKT